MNKIANMLFLGALLVVSRLIGLPANMQPLLGIGVVAPYISKSELSVFYPLVIMYASDVFLGFHDHMAYTYVALMLSGIISRLLYNKIYTSLICSWLIWHILANIGLTYPPFTPEALLFDLRFLLSGLSVVVLYDVCRRLWQTAYREV